MHNKILQFKLCNKTLRKASRWNSRAKLRKAYFLSHKHALIFIRACHQVRKYPSITITTLQRGYMVTWLSA